jgi:RNase adapter protein RapZ
MSKIRLIIISGVAGAGKTTVASVCEEHAYYVVEDIPLKMFPSLLDLFKKEPANYSKVAIFVSLDNAEDFIKTAKTDPHFNVSALGLDCSIDILMGRFKLTRHIHPLQPKGYTLIDALKSDERLMGQVRSYFDIYLDTSGLSEKDLRKLTSHFLGDKKSMRMNVCFSSFGYKFGLPRDAEVVIDARVLKNPYWVPELSRLTGLDKAVIAYIDADPKTSPFMKKLFSLLEDYLLAAEEEGRNFVFIDIGCSGGQHRSVYVTERLYDHFKNKYNCAVTHRELSRYVDEDRN